MIAVSPKPPQTGGGCMVLVVLLGSENLRISFYFERLEVTSKNVRKILDITTQSVTELLDRRNSSTIAQLLYNH